MKVVVAPNAFKGALSAINVAEAMARGVTDAIPDVEVRKVPLADGGDGTMETLVAATAGTIRKTTASDPLGRPVSSAFGILGGGRTAVIEMAAASGLRLLRPDEYNPMRTTTFGTGELVRAALEEGVEAILLGIGGSATTDGGIGISRSDTRALSSKTSVGLTFPAWIHVSKGSQFPALVTSTTL
jgi:glycerate kinase